MIDGKLIAQKIHFARQSAIDMALSADETAALSSYIAMLEKTLLQYCAYRARQPDTPQRSTLIIEDLVRDIEVALEGIKERMAKDG